jgi:spore coat polysaccharide biosynthesis protein SpsF
LFKSDQTITPEGRKMGALIQARTGSTRLPGKTIRRIAGRPILTHVIERVKLSTSVKNIYIATTINEQDNEIVDLCNRLAIGVFRGSAANVLERLFFAGLRFNLSTVIRITADNPLVGPDVLDFMVQEHINNKNHLTTNYHSKSFPNGTVLSVLDMAVLEYLCKKSENLNVREHIITNLDLLKRNFKVQVVEASPGWRRYDLRYCVDYEADLKLVSQIIEHFARLGISPSTADIIEFLDAHAEVKQINQEYAAQGY